MRFTGTRHRKVDPHSLVEAWRPIMIEYCCMVGTIEFVKLKTSLPEAVARDAKICGAA